MNNSLINCLARFGKAALKPFFCAAFAMALSTTSALTTNYIGTNGQPDTADCTEITSSSTALNTGWYVVNGNVSIGSTVTVNGDVNLILADGAKLTVTGSSYGAGISVVDDGETVNSLAIYCQDEGTGELASTGGFEGAGIGGNIHCNSGTITIYGGVITATGGSYGAGIGGGDYGSGGTVAVYGGKVTATTSNSGSSAGIGKGDGSGTNGMLTVGPGLAVMAGSSEATATSLTPDSVTREVVLSGQKWFYVGAPSLRQKETELFEGYHSGVSINVSLSDTIVGGSGTYTFTEKANLPSWLSISGMALVGMPPSVGTWTFTLTATDASDSSLTLDAEYTLYVQVTGDVSVTFVGEGGVSRTETCTVVESSFTTLSDTGSTEGWYVVHNDVEFTSSITISGNVKLVLMDGKAMSVITSDSDYNAPIHVAPGNSFTIYGQSGGTGRVETVSGVSIEAGIGGNSGQSNGPITINGGTVVATGNAGIGGGYQAAGGEITINGGTVTATSTSGAGIGGGSGSNPGAGGTVAINGGTVTATGGYSGTGIGGGSSAVNQGTLTVGANVVVKAGSSSYLTDSDILPHGDGGAITLSGQRYFAIETVGPVPLSQVTSALAAYAGEAFNISLASTISGGSGSYTFSGTVPDGVTLNDGVLTGTLSAGVYNFTLAVTDSESAVLTPSASYTLTVSARPKSITYKDGDSTIEGLSPAQYTPGTATDLAPSATKTGYTFAGWYDNAGLTGAAVTTIGTEATDNLTFWAKWTPVAYEITYMDGDTQMDGLTPTTYTIEAAAALPETATKAGKGFYGWYDNSGCTGSAVTTIPAGSTGDKIFYAKWGAEKVNTAYVDAAGNAMPEQLCAVVTSETTTLETGWHVVNADVTINGKVTISGNVNLVLADGATLTVSSSVYGGTIDLKGANTLTIYGQTNGTGALIASKVADTSGPAIGSTDSTNPCGTLMINGGTITATGNNAGIGGGWNMPGGTIVINGGTVTANAGWGAAAIGGAGAGNGGSVTINGGRVIANGGEDGGAGIGGGRTATSQGTLTVGAKVVVKAGASANPDTVLERGAGGAITLNGQQYFTTETLVLAQAETEIAAYAGEAFELSLADTITGGVPAYTFSGLTPDNLGLTLTSNGTLSGMLAAGVYNLTLTVTDTESTSINASYTLTVTAKPKSITYKDGDSTIEGLSPTQYTPGTVTALAASATKVGYTFVGWYANVELTGDAVTEVSAEETENLTFWAKWTPVEYTITYMDGSAMMSGLTPATYTIEAAVTLPETATKAGYGFYGWYDNAGCTGDAVTTIPANSTGNKMFYAKWGVIKTNASYIDASGNEQTAECIEIGANTTTLETGWYVVNGDVTINSGKLTISGNVNIILADSAILTVASSSYGGAVDLMGDNTLAIFGQANGSGALVASKVAETSGPAIGSADSTNPCGILTINGGNVTATGDSAGIGGGWNMPGGTVIINGGVVTATGGWGAAAIGGAGTGDGGSVTINGGYVVANGGESGGAGIGGGRTATSQGTLTVGAKVVVKAGASANPDTVLERGVGGAITLNGQQYFTIETLVLAQAETEIAAYAGEAFELSLADTVTGGAPAYMFSGLTPDNLGLTLTTGGTLSGTLAAGVYNIALTVTDSDLDSINASYTLTVTNRPKSITYKDGDSTIEGLSPTQYTPGTATALAPSATKTGYTFAGWYDNAGLTGAAVTTIGTEATEPLTFYAKWTPVEYTITYMDGSMPMGGLTPSAYTIEAAATLPETATKAGYGFYGWYDNSGCTGDAVTTIPANSTGDKTFYAKWGVAKSNETYIDASGNEQIAECAEISSDTTSFVTGWYVVKNDVTINGKVTVSGNVNILLCDGASLTVNAPSSSLAIEVKGSNTLTIYGQENGTGALTANANSWGPGIGSDDSSNPCGTITVNGGIVTAVGRTGAGIGGGYNKPGGTVIVNGGTVIATGDSDGAGIGGYGTSYKATGSLVVSENVIVMAKTDDSGATFTVKPHGANGEITLEGERYYKIVTPKTATVSYRDADGVMKSAACKLVTVDINALATGWYAVTNNIDFGVSGVTISGDVKLVIADGASLAVEGLRASPYSAGINVPVGSSLTIYGQEEGSGTINAVGGYFSAGIGGRYQQSAGAITINGGNVTATANGTYSGAAGIGGGGNGGNGGTVTINGGRVEATGNAGAGIGKGQNGTDNGTLIVNSTMSVMAGASPSSVEELSRNETTGEITLSGQEYFVVSHMPLNQLTADIAAFVGEAFELALSTTVIGGKLPYTFVQKSGTLPNGLTFNAGVISGTPTATASETVVFTVTDSGTSAHSEDFTYTLTVTLRPKAITYMDGETALTGLTPAEYVEGTGATLATGATKTGYMFAGWYDNPELAGDAVTTIGAEATEPLTFYAKWTPVEYTITYKHGDKTLTGLTPASYTMESATITLPTPDEAFCGWYESSSFTGDSVQSIPAGSYGDKTFYGMWMPSVTFIGADGVETSETCTEIVQSMTTWNSGWYVVSEDVTIDSTVTVSGDVNLILADDATLTVTETAYGKAGILVPWGHSLTIYAQQDGTGRLIASASSAGAGIGGCREVDCGRIVVNGGLVTAQGGNAGAGIGGGNEGDGGDVFINGGIVTAYGGGNAPGIGAGVDGTSQGTLTLGDNVKLEVSKYLDSTDPTKPRDLVTVCVGGEVELYGDMRYFIAEKGVQASPSTYLAFTSPNPFTIKVDSPSWRSGAGELRYSTDTVNWILWDGSLVEAADVGESYALYFRGTGNSKITSSPDETNWVIDGNEVSCTGDIETLRDWRGNPPQMASMCFYGMFKGCSALVSAPTLSSMSLAEHCYSYMFQDCVNLITIPELPATSLKSQCYDSMFNGCTSLRISESAPGTEWALPGVVRASLIVANSHMFQNTGGSFTDSPTNEVYYVKGENDPDVPIQKMRDIYANSSEINIDLRGTLFGGSGSLTFDATADMPEGLSLNAGVLQGALTAGNYTLSLRVTDSHFEKSVNLSYTLHAVASIPEFTQTTNAIGPYSAYILAYSNLKDTLSGYVGTCIFSETHGTQNKLPTGIRLYESGGLSINDKLAAGSYTFDVTVTDGALRTLNCTYVLTIAPNEPAVIDESSPSDGMVTVYGGEDVTFSVTAHDPEEQDMVYYWYLDGAPLVSQGPSYIYSYTPNAYGSVEKPTRTLQCRVWDRNTTVIAKTWTINQPGWRYEITTDTLEDATTGEDYMAQLAGVGHGGDAEWYLADGDRLPPGLAMGVDGVISGRARMAGIYAFTVLREEGNAIVSKELTLEVTGENAATTTFGPLANDSGLQMLLGQTILGDTIVFADGAEISTLDANDFPGVIFSVPSGTATFVVDVEAPLDAQSLVVAAGAKVVFKAVAAHPYFGHYDLVQMPATMAGSWSVDAPFFFATAPAVGSDGVLGFDALGGKDAEDDTLTVLFPDGPDVRAHELTGFDTDGGLVYSDESSVDGQSVLGSTLTLNGYNRFGGVISQIEGNTAIVLKQGATLDIGSVYELGGSLVFAEGSSFKFGAPTEGAVVSNASLEGAIVPPSSGTASLVLKGTLGDGQSVTVFNYYTGSVESFQLVLPDVVDSTNYSLVRENGCLVVKCAVPLHEGDTGTLTVTGNDSVNSSFGVSLPGYMVTADGGTAPYKWTCPYATYDITREANSFDGSSGAAELAIRQRLPYSQRNIVDLGFDFPFGGYLQNQVSIGLNGCISIKRGNSETGRICVFGDDAPYFATVNDIFVSRSATTATIRFGHRVAVTLASDGKIRVAYGPLAEGAQRRYMPCDIEIKDMTDNFDRVARFEAENGAYNGIDDVVFTQTSMIPGGLSPYANGNMIGLSGIVSAPSGSYPVKFRCVDANGYVIEKTITVTVSGGNSSLVKSTATTPAVEADGTCHISYGDSQTFTVAGIDPSACRWYEDNVLKETGVLSYTFDSSTGPWPTLSKSLSDFDKHTKLVTCRVLDPLYGGQELTVASWQVIVNVTYYIDASVVDSAANGTQEHPFRTIPYNINDELTSGAFPGDVFLFRPGKYKLPFVAPDGFAVTLRSTDGADATVITVDDADKACVMQSGADGASRAMRVEGFTLENAGGRAAYGGTLVNCVLRDSALAADHGVSDDDLGYGGGAYGSRLVNCLVSNCSAVYGGGVAASELRNCTVVCNYADELGGALDGASVAYNTVFWGNLAGSDEHDSSPTEQTPVPGYILPLVPTTYACLYAEDPLLYADGRPAVGSPCIDAGDSSYIALDVEGALYDLAGDARSQVGNVSIGAYENAVDNGPCRIMVKATGAGTVLEAPYADVDYGEDAMFRFRGRLAAVVCTNGVLAAENVSSYVWPAVTQPGELSVTFAPTDLYVDSSKGSFDNDGLSWDSPKYSISDAISSAGDGDVIHVKPGLYGSTYVSQLNKLSNLRIVSTGGRDVTIIDAQHIGSCFDVALDFVKNTSWERHGIVLEGFTLQNGRATGRLGGGGACGGTLVNCIIQNCESIGRFTTTDTACGGGASGSALINCIVRNCRAGKSVSEGTWYSNEAEGGGVWGGYAEKCEIYGNSCWGTTRSEGPGTYETILRDCYVYNNMIGTLQDREATIPAANAVRNTAGDAVQIRSATREPTTEERNDTTERIYVAESKAYDSEEEAVEAAVKQKPDIATEIASEIKDKIDEYIGMFEIQTVRNEDTGKWENRSVFKEDVKAELAEDLTDALASSIVADSLVEASTGVTSFVLEDPKPGLYYSVEFSESIGGSAVFSGQRYLSNGHSVRLTVEYRDTPVGYWRMAIYMTPDGED